MNVFLVCLLACTITTAVGVLILSLVYIQNSQPHPEVHLGLEAWPLQTVTPTVQKAVDPKFQFLNHLPDSKVCITHLGKRIIYSKGDFETKFPLSVH